MLTTEILNSLISQYRPTIILIQPQHEGDLLSQMIDFSTFTEEEIERLKTQFSIHKFIGKYKEVLFIRSETLKRTPPTKDSPALFTLRLLFEKDRGKTVDVEYPSQYKYFE